MPERFDYILSCPKCGRPLEKALYPEDVALYCPSHEATRHIHRNPTLDALIGTKLFDVLVLDPASSPMTVILRPEDLRGLLQKADIDERLINWPEEPRGAASGESHG